MKERVAVLRAGQEIGLRIHGKERKEQSDESDESELNG